LLPAACLALSLIVGGASAQECPDIDHNHAAWTAILAAHVDDGRVDYAGLQRGAHAELTAYLQALSSVCRTTYETWSDAQQLAFWINAYNAFTIRLILDNYPLESIRDIGFLPGAAFRSEFIPFEKLEGDEISLNHIEHDVLRAHFNEPRIHFALVCASVSCPPLRSEAYSAAELGRQLDDQARNFLADPTKNSYDAAGRTLYLSSIFEWFEEDFENSAGSVKAFVARYLVGEAAAAALRDETEVEHLPYDWGLNGQ